MLTIRIEGEPTAGLEDSLVALAEKAGDALVIVNQHFLGRSVGGKWELPKTPSVGALNEEPEGAPVEVVDKRWKSGKAKE